MAYFEWLEQQKYRQWAFLMPKSLPQGSHWETEIGKSFLGGLWGFNGEYWVKNCLFLVNNLVLEQFLASNFIFPAKYIHIDSQIMISLIKLLNVYIEEGSWA